MADVNAGTVYEWCRAEKATQKPLSNMQVKRQIEKLTGYFGQENVQYFMFLCHDRRYYTVFNFHEGKSDFSIGTALTEFEAILHEQGDILEIEKDEYGLAYEIWIKDTSTGEAFAYYLFPYDAAVIEV